MQFNANPLNGDVVLAMTFGDTKLSLRLSELQALKWAEALKNPEAELTVEDQRAWPRWPVTLVTREPQPSVVSAIRRVVDSLKTTDPVGEERPRAFFALQDGRAVLCWQESPSTSMTLDVREEQMAGYYEAIESISDGRNERNAAEIRAGRTPDRSPFMQTWQLERGCLLRIEAHWNWKNRWRS